MARTRPRTPLRQELPLVGFLAVVWMALWQSFSLGTLIIGFVLGLIIVRIFYLPPLRASGRINPFWALVFSLRFLWQMVEGSFAVSWLVLTRGPRIRNSIISVQLRSHDDLIITFTGHALALVPGAFVIDVDRSTATLYLHTLNVYDEHDAERIRQDALRTEALLIRAIGTESDLSVVRAERRLGRVAGFSKTEREEG